MSLSSPVSFRTDLALLISRIAVGFTFAAHGYQKLVTYTLDGTAAAFEGMGIPLPYLSAVMATFTELLGGMALMLGIATRLTSIPLFFTMLVAVFGVHISGGFFAPEGFEYAMILGVASLGFVLQGGGAFSVDRFLRTKVAPESRMQIAFA